jgi:uncharacterized membrane protein YgcG
MHQQQQQQQQLRLANFLASLQEDHPAGVDAGPVSMQESEAVDTQPAAAAAAAAAAAPPTHHKLPAWQHGQQLQEFAAAAALLRLVLIFIFAGCYGDASIAALAAALHVAAQHNAAVEASGLLTSKHKEQLLLVSVVDLKEEGCLFILQRTPLHMLVSNVLVSADEHFVPQGYCPGWYDLTAVRSSCTRSSRNISSSSSSSGGGSSSSKSSSMQSSSQWRVTQRRAAVRADEAQAAADVQKRCH